jgi:hypothetical protein
MNTGSTGLTSLPDRTTMQRWASLPTRRLGNGARVSRLAVCLDGAEGGLMTVVVTAWGNRLALSFQLVEIRPVLDGEQDPRLGQILIDRQLTRLTCFGLAETVWRATTRTTLTTLVTSDHDMLVPALLQGQLLIVRIEGRSFSAALGNLRALLIDALREVCDPKQFPLTRWLAD